MVRITVAILNSYSYFPWDKSLPYMVILGWWIAYGRQFIKRRAGAERVRKGQSCPVAHAVNHWATGQL